jgi:hypothetical protein
MPKQRGLTRIAIMKKAFVFGSVMVIAAVAMAPAVMADTVILIQNAYSYDVGGEFTAVTGSSYNYNANYAASTLISTAAGVGFSTFCVQTGTDFAPYNAPWNNTTPYDFTTSLASVGGPGYPGGSAPLGQPFSYYLAEGTAYLYSQFAKGTLAGYDYNTGNDSTDAAARLADAGLLQSAIWALQGGQSYGGYPNGVTGNVFYNDALSFLGANVDVAATSSTDFGVEVMNLTLNGAGNNYQNQLVYLGNPPTPTPSVPDGGTTLVLLGMGLSGLAIFRRR